MPRLQPVRFDPQALVKGITDSISRWEARLRGTIAEFQRRIGNLPQTNYELGLAFAADNKVKDAAFRFKVALYFAPGFVQAWYNLGCCQLALGHKEKAVQAFRKTLSLAPGHTDAKFMLATIDPSLLDARDRPTRMPHHMMEGFFARIAPQYNLIEGEMRYAGPQQLHEVLHGKLRRNDPAIFDIGCGTGLASMPWRKEARRIVGADVTPEMAAIARAATLEGVPVFNTVLVADVNTLQFSPEAEAFDLVLALNVLPFAGEVSALVAHAARAAAPGALVALSHEAYNGPGGYGIVPATGRFGHSVEYLRQVGEQVGLQPAGQVMLAMYPELKHALLLFSKPQAAA